MVIYGRSDLEHDRHLINFLDICRKNTPTLNPDKMQFRLPQVSFFGHQWSAKGLSPDPKKIAAVKRMDLPRDVDTMRSFLGLVNYLNRFSPHLAEISAPLREICRQDVEFGTNQICTSCFLQDKRGAEKNYQNLERECSAMIWGMEKFHYFLYGKQFTLETDQKPLVSIY